MHHLLRRKPTYDPEDEKVINHLQSGAHCVLLAFVVDQRVKVEQQQEGEVGSAVDDEFHKRGVDDLADARAGHQKVADRQQRPKYGHAQDGGYLQTGVFATVARRLSEPNGVEELLTVGLSHKLSAKESKSIWM